MEDAMLVYYDSLWNLRDLLTTFRDWHGDQDAYSAAASWWNHFIGNPYNLIVGLSTTVPAEFNGARVASFTDQMQGHIEYDLLPIINEILYLSNIIDPGTEGRLNRYDIIVRARSRLDEVPPELPFFVQALAPDAAPSDSDDTDDSTHTDVGVPLPLMPPDIPSTVDSDGVRAQRLTHMQNNPYPRQNEREYVDWDAFDNDQPIDESARRPGVPVRAPVGTRRLRGIYRR
jgi:hypothetical protein